MKISTVFNLDEIVKCRRSDIGLHGKALIVGIIREIKIDKYGVSYLVDFPMYTITPTTDAWVQEDFLSAVENL